jgi:hypothetical protein
VIPLFNIVRLIMKLISSEKMIESAVIEAGTQFIDSGVQAISGVVARRA